MSDSTRVKMSRMNTLLDQTLSRIDRLDKEAFKTGMTRDIMEDRIVASTYAETLKKDIQELHDQRMADLYASATQRMFDQQIDDAKPWEMEKKEEK